MSSTPNCPCDAFVHPQTISNLPGQNSIRYRVGDYTSFRQALLLALTDDLGNNLEFELANWKPTASSDLALQMIEWWAYLADILTFYNERIANEDYLRTASSDDAVRRLIGLLGYRPRPGIGAMATVAAITKSNSAFTIPQGFALQSKPGPGKQPQIFELDAATVVQPLSQVSADPAPDSSPLGADGSVLVRGTITSVKAGDQLLVVERGWSGTDPNYEYAKVLSVSQEKNPRGKINTRIRFAAPLALPATASPAGYQLMRSTQTAQVWQYNNSDQALAPEGNSGTVHLNSLTRKIRPGDMILFQSSGGFGRATISTGIESGAVLSASGAAQRLMATPKRAAVFQASQQALTTDFTSIARPTESFVGVFTAASLQLSSVTANSDLIWYANADDNTPASPPSNTAIAGIAIPHSVLTFTPAYSNSILASLTVRYNWQEVGTLIPIPATSFSPASAQLTAVKPPNFPAGSVPVLLEDAKGNGESATSFVGTDNTTITSLSDLAQDAPTLAAPISVLFNLLSMSRGKSVKNEILGSGDAALAGQEFVLKKSPVTYLLSADSSAGGNYKSTLRVGVNGIEWQEVASFYGQAASATIFVTREDEDGQTHVQFGDGVNGARLPSGTNNVVASYRFGSGADAPDIGKLTTIVTPQPGLASIHNPVAAGGGADPEPASQIRQYAPLSVLTFGRAVSGDDYEAIAASAPGVTRARAYWSFDALQQRTVVTVYVGDDDAAVNAAQLALRGDADPNRAVSVQLATPVNLQISFTLAIDSKFVSSTVVAAVETALLDPDHGLFGTNRIGVGEVIYASRIYEASLAIPGVLAVHSLNVRTLVFSPIRLALGVRNLLLTRSPLTFSSSAAISGGTSSASSSNAAPEVSINQIVSNVFAIPSILRSAPQYRFDPGQGGYFALNSDALTITLEGSSNAG